MGNCIVLNIKIPHRLKNINSGWKVCFIINDDNKNLIPVVWVVYINILVLESFGAFVFLFGFAFFKIVNWDRLPLRNMMKNF